MLQRQLVTSYVGHWFDVPEDEQAEEEKHIHSILLGGILGVDTKHIAITDKDDDVWNYRLKVIETVTFSVSVPKGAPYCIIEERAVAAYETAVTE
jgi:hypothetical protein